MRRLEDIPLGDAGPDISLVERKDIADCVSSRKVYDVPNQVQPSHSSRIRAVGREVVTAAARYGRRKGKSWRKPRRLRVGQNTNYKMALSAAWAKGSWVLDEEGNKIVSSFAPLPPPCKGGSNIPRAYSLPGPSL